MDDNPIDETPPPVHPVWQFAIDGERIDDTVEAPNPTAAVEVLLERRALAGIVEVYAENAPEWTMQFNADGDA